ncbi:hypothetical protein K491DRAFT_713151 [Lophiostoma macrostomum CBS 122681]|uniref:Uncharacterized protein n=1 Tax=Lophiostoma macrostomum CBS 122681 TaxID=1314788 RepID=A0A6A6TGP5_9PLEO|nr:hypothetical protein K491DRAFT_713151 [Lophiostoma macrostomum CBS 122681]
MPISSSSPSSSSPPIHAHMHTSSTPPPPHPDFDPSTGSLSLKDIDTTSMAFNTSYERTPIPKIPFPHPKWHAKHTSSADVVARLREEVYEEYDAEMGFGESFGGVRESVEIGNGNRTESEDDVLREGGEERRGERLVDMITRMADMSDRDGGWPRNWMGYVQWPESGVRSSIAREAKRARDERQIGEGGVVCADMGSQGRGTKRLRVKY